MWCSFSRRTPCPTRLGRKRYGAVRERDPTGERRKRGVVGCVGFLRRRPLVLSLQEGSGAGAAASASLRRKRSAVGKWFCFNVGRARGRSGSLRRVIALDPKFVGVARA